MKISMPDGSPKCGSVRDSRSAMMEQPKYFKDNQASGNPAEKRACPRYPFSRPVEAVDIAANTRIMGRLSDIARFGCYVETISPFAVKATALLTITRRKQSFKTPARVVYSQIGMGMGLIFTTTDAAEVGILENWLSELAGGQPCEPDAANCERHSDVANNAAPLLQKVVRDLIILLSRKEIVNDAEAKAMLQKLSK